MPSPKNRLPVRASMYEAHVLIDLFVLNYIIMCCIQSCLVVDLWRPIFYHGLTLIPVWISNHMSGKLWDKNTYPFPNFNGCTVEVWELMNNFIPRFIMNVINDKSIVLNKSPAVENGLLPVHGWDFVCWSLQTKNSTSPEAVSRIMSCQVYHSRSSAVRALGM